MTKTIAILGGMGAYATLHLHQRILDAFPAKKEWERPRIIIDSNTLLPSRVRAILYGEHKSELIEGLTHSLRQLLYFEPDYIVIDCNTAHYFMPEIKMRLPDLRKVLIELPSITINHCLDKNFSEVLLVASEGTMLTRIYEKYAKNDQVHIHYPPKEDWAILRTIIEQGKKNEPSEEFFNYILASQFDNIILGCTEFSLLVTKKNHSLTNKNIIDPLEILIKELRQ